MLSSISGVISITEEDSSKLRQGPQNLPLNQGEDTNDLSLSDDDLKGLDDLGQGIER